MSETECRVTLNEIQAWTSFGYVASDPMRDVIDAITWIQAKSEGHDPELISIRRSVWSALLSSHSAREYVVEHGYSIAAFKKLTGARDVRIFEDSSPAEYDFRATRETFVYEIAGAICRRTL